MHLLPSPSSIRTIAPRLRLGFGSRSGGSQTIAPEESCSRLGLGFGLGLVLGLGGTFFLRSIIVLLSKFTIVLGIKFSLYMFSNVFKNSVMFYRGAQVIIQRCSVKKVFLKISQNSQEDICTRVSVLKSCRPKKRLWHRCFPMKFANFLRTPIFIKYLWWLLLEVDSKSSLTSKDLFFAAIFRKISNPKMFNWVLNTPLFWYCVNSKSSEKYYFLSCFK